MERLAVTQPLVVSDPECNLTFIPSGSKMLDLAIGGGWANGRVFNVVGDKSTGKTLLAIEAFANFSKMFPNGRMRYGEAEGAFDTVFAEQLGFPNEVERPEGLIDTVEEFYLDLERFASKPGPSLYILDSLDALSDASELNEKLIEASDDVPQIGGYADDQEQTSSKLIRQKGSYGVAKAKQMSKLFRKLIEPLGSNNCTLGIISQVRDNIGVKFGDHYTRSGGRALDFYASQIVWLSQIKQIKRTVKGQDRTVGITIKAKCKKNKVAFPFREAEMDIVFGYGIDDEKSMITWLKSIKAFNPDEAKDYENQLKDVRDEHRNQPALRQLQETLKRRCEIEWSMLENALAPKYRKYE